MCVGGQPIKAIEEIRQPNNTISLRTIALVYELQNVESLVNVRNDQCPHYVMLSMITFGL